MSNTRHAHNAPGCHQVYMGPPLPTACLPLHPRNLAGAPGGAGVGIFGNSATIQAKYTLTTSYQRGCSQATTDQFTTAASFSTTIVPGSGNCTYVTTQIDAVDATINQPVYAYVTGNVFYKYNGMYGLVWQTISWT